MKFMTIVRGPELTTPPPMELFTAIAELGEEATKEGVFVDMGGLLPSSMGARVRVARGKLSVTDGPFTEAKEIVGGYAIFDVGSKEEALKWTTRFMELHIEHWPEWEGETEVRQMAEEGELPQ